MGSEIRCLVSVTLFFILKKMKERKKVLRTPQLHLGRWESAKSLQIFSSSNINGFHGNPNADKHLSVLFFVIVIVFYFRNCSQVDSLWVLDFFWCSGGLVLDYIICRSA